MRIIKAGIAKGRLALLLLALAGGVSVRAEVPPECRLLKISGNPEFIPWTWEVDGRLEGASVRIARLVAEMNDLRMEPVFAGPLKRNIALLLEGRLDMLVSLPKTTIRAAHIRYTDFYAVDEVVLVKKSDRRLRYAGWDDLRGRKIATTQGNSWGEFLDLHLNNNTTVFRTTSLDGLLKMVEIERADFGLHRYYSMLTLLDHPRYRDRFQMLHNHVNVMTLHFGFNDSGPCAGLTRLFSESLAVLRRSGTVSRIVQEEFLRVRQPLAGAVGTP